MAADWPLIAETLFREAFATLDLAAAGDPHVPAILHRAQAGAYDRLAAGPDAAGTVTPGPVPAAGCEKPRRAPGTAFKA